MSGGGGGGGLGCLGLNYESFKKHGYSSNFGTLKLNSVRLWMFIRASEESLSCAASITFSPQKTANILNSVQKERATKKTNNTPCSILRNFACILYLHHVTFSIKHGSNYPGCVLVVTRKTNTRCKKRKIYRRSKKNKSRRDEEANSENTSIARLEHRTSYTSC